MEKFYNLEEYIDGNLNGKELIQLEEELSKNQMFTAELELRREVNELIRDKQFSEIVEILDRQLKSNSYSVMNIQKDVLKTWHMAAASFALILVAGGLWYILSNKPFSTEKLVSKYYKPASPIGQFRSLEISPDDALKEAFNFYEQNDYVNALRYFNSLENQITAKFYSGICYIELEQFDKAINSFEFIINDKDNLFVEQAEWYMGLIYLMNNQKSQAISQFDKISKSDSYYANQAKEIIKYLN